MCGGCYRRTFSILTFHSFIDEYNDLGTYNGDTEHDMWIDFDSYENTVPPMSLTKRTSMIILIT